MSYIGKRAELNRKRRSALIPQAVLAMELGISASLYSNIENGYSIPSPEVAKKLILKFDLPVDYFTPKGE